MAFCAAHKREGRGRKTEEGETDAGAQPRPSETFAERMAREDAERRRQAAEEFRARLEAGDYRGLFGEQLNALMAQAAAEAGVADELAVLRIVMARLLAEEPDPVVLAKAISRVASVSIQAARAQRAITGHLAEGITELLTTLLMELTPGGDG